MKAVLGPSKLTMLSNDSKLAYLIMLEAHKEAHRRDPLQVFAVPKIFFTETVSQLSHEEET